MTRRFNWTAPALPAHDTGEGNQVRSIVESLKAQGLIKVTGKPAGWNKPLPPPTTERAARGAGEAQAREMWVRSQRGENARDIARACRVSMATVRRIVGEIRRGERRVPRAERD